MIVKPHNSNDFDKTCIKNKIDKLKTFLQQRKQTANDTRQKTDEDILYNEMLSLVKKRGITAAQFDDVAVKIRKQLKSSATTTVSSKSAATTISLIEDDDDEDFH